MKDFYDKLKDDIKAYEGRHDLTPEWYKLMTNLLDDPRMPHRLKPLASCAIAYFIIPADVISEEIHGPYGYIDDIYFCAFIANEIRKRTKDPAIIEENWEGEGDILELIEEVLGQEKKLIEDKKIEENWEGEGDILELIEEVLGQEKKLIEDKKKLILNYTGCSELLGMLGE